MSRGVNKAIIIGRLGADPEQRRTQSGALVVNLRVATTEQWQDQESKERRESTEWHRVVFFGRLAEIAAQYLRKGSQVYVEGRLQTRKWQDSRTGHDRYSTEIVGRELNMLDSRGDSGRDDYERSPSSYGGESQSGGYSQPSSPPPESSGSVSDDPIDDMPW